MASRPFAAKIHRRNAPEFGIGGIDPSAVYTHTRPFSDCDIRALAVYSPFQEGIGQLFLKTSGFGVLECITFFILILGVVA
jgi:hypothetical protein